MNTSSLFEWPSNIQSDRKRCTFRLSGSGVAIPTLTTRHLHAMSCQTTAFQLLSANRQRWRAKTRQNILANLLELVTDVQLVRVKQQQDEVTSGSKPAAHINEVVGALYALLLA